MSNNIWFAEYLETGYLVFNIRYPAGYRIAEKWQDFAGYRMLNLISGPSLVKRPDL